MYKRTEQKRMDSLLTKEIVSLINEQIWLENNASFYYLYLSTQFKENGIRPRFKIYIKN